MAMIARIGRHDRPVRVLILLACGHREVPWVVIVPDVNLLLYAVVSAFPQHKPAHAWWEEAINSSAEIGLASPPSSGSSG
jgi:hypothetical protein